MKVKRQRKHAIKSKFLPAVKKGQEKKDLATPRLATCSMVENGRKIEKRTTSVEADSKHKVHKNSLKSLPHMNKISMLLAQIITPATAKDHYLHNKAKRGMEQQWPSAPASEMVRHPPCHACGAPTNDSCICAGVVHKFLVKQQLRSFIAGYRAPQNPIHTPLDPDDQEELQVAMERVLARTLVGSATAVGKCTQIVRISYFAAMTGLASTVEAAGELAVKSNYKKLRKKLESMDVVHRGGQHPGPVSRDQLAGGLEEFMSTLGNSLAVKLMRCTKRSNARVRQERLYGTVNALKLCASKEENGVRGISTYKAKKVAEMIILIGLSERILCCHITLSDLLCLFGAWPIPDNSRAALRKIYPGLKTDQEHQMAMRAISLSLG